MASALGMNLSSISNTNAHSVSQSFFDDLEGILARGEAGDLDSAELFEVFLVFLLRTLINFTDALLTGPSRSTEDNLQLPQGDPRA
jgi:hypothetical protein